MATPRLSVTKARSLSQHPDHPTPPSVGDAYGRIFVDPFAMVGQQVLYFYLYGKLFKPRLPMRRSEPRHSYGFYGIALIIGTLPSRVSLFVGRWCGRINRNVVGAWALLVGEGELIMLIIVTFPCWRPHRGNEASEIIAVCPGDLPYCKRMGRRVVVNVYTQFRVSGAAFAGAEKRCES